MGSIGVQDFLKMDNGNYEFFVHHRPLGKKVNGLYQNVPWSDVAIQNVPLEKTLYLEVQNKYIEHMNYVESMKGINKRMINSRVMNDSIRYSGTNKVKYEDDYIGPYRSRKILTKKKKYPVKPKREYTRDHNKHAAHLRYN